MATFPLSVFKFEGRLASGRVRFYKGDVRDEALVKRAVRDVDAVVHSAAVITCAVFCGESSPN